MSIRSSLVRIVFSSSESSSHARGVGVIWLNLWSLSSGTRFMKPFASSRLSVPVTVGFLSPSRSSMSFWHMGVPLLWNRRISISACAVVRSYRATTLLKL